MVRREAVHTHNPFGAASRAATNEQRKRAALIGLWAARWSRARHQVPREAFIVLLQCVLAPLPLTEGQGGFFLELALIVAGLLVYQRPPASTSGLHTLRSLYH